MNIDDFITKLNEQLAEILGYENIEHHSFGTLEECCSYYRWLSMPLLIDDDLR